jgi:CheY-like chemotaxis protein
MKKIAIIEDEPSIAQLYQIKLGSLGYQTYIAINGKLGLELIESVKPDLVLLDLLMPEMSGEEMLIALRKKENYKDLPVVILTNVSPQEAPESLKELGVKKYIVKAEYTPEQVGNIVKEALES